MCKIEELNQSISENKDINVYLQNDGIEVLKQKCWIIVN